MSPLATATPPAAAPSAEGASRLFDAGGETLEDRVIRAWDELSGAGRTACPVCAAEMTAAGGCRVCGSELS